MSFSFDQIVPQLFQGSMPPCGFPLRDVGIRALVLCAREYQPAADCFPGVQVHRVHLNDAVPSKDDIRRALEAADFVARRLARLGMRPGDAVYQVRSRRQGALFNKAFVEAIHRVAPRFRGRDKRAERRR